MNLEIWNILELKIVKLENELYCEQERTDRHFIANTHTHTHIKNVCNGDGGDGTRGRTESSIGQFSKQITNLA